MLFKQQSDPNFALHTGDFVETAEIEDEWLDLYDQSRPSFMSLPVASHCVTMTNMR